MSKRTQEDAGEERVTAKSKPMMNLVSRSHVRVSNVLASTASESPGKTWSDSQNVPLSSSNVQQTSTGRPVFLASSSNYSKWNNDDKWSFQAGNLVKCRKQVRVNPNMTILSSMMLWTSNTATESNLSLRSRSFLKGVNDRLRKMLDRSP